MHDLVEIEFYLLRNADEHKFVQSNYNYCHCINLQSKSYICLEYVQSATILISLETRVFVKR